MYSDVRRDIHEMGTRVHPQTMQDLDVSNDKGFETLELSPYAFQIIDGSDRADWLYALGKNLTWFREEFRERVSGKQLNPGSAWVERPDVWEKFIHDGKFAYTYSERFNRFIIGEDATVLTHVFHELHERPETRQAILPMFDVNLDTPNMGGRARIPCSLHYQFMRRDGALQLMYVMRSSDFLTHFPYDIALALELQAYMAGLLRIPVGRFTFFTGSLHLYAKDADPGVF
jgi:thymidylate synthase